MNPLGPFDEWALGKGHVAESAGSGRPLFRDGMLTLEETSARSTYRLRFGEIATFHIDCDTRQVSAEPAGAVTWREVEDIYRDQVLPRLVGSSGRLVLHATTIAREGRAYLLVGASGQGKSTLAAALHRRGWTVLGDDAALIDPDRFRAHSPLADIRLRDDSRDAVGLSEDDGEPVSYSGKSRYRASAGQSDPLPLGAMLVLGAAEDEQACRKLAQREACMALLAQRFALDPGDGAVAGRHLQAASALVRRIPVAEIAYPRRYDALDAVCGFIDDTLMALATAPEPA